MCGIFTFLKAHSELDFSKIKEYVRSFVEVSENGNPPLSNDVKDYKQIEVPKLNLSEIVKVINNRGPDYSNIVEYTFDSDINISSIPSVNNIDPKLFINKDFDLLEYSQKKLNEIKHLFLSSVLSLRGINQIAKQPFMEKDFFNLLQYNGEIFGVKKEREMKYINFIDLNKLDLFYENDGLQLFSLFNEISLSFYKNYKQKLVKSQEIKEDMKNINEVYAEHFFELINNIESDHAFVYFDNLNKKIIFNRDLFGKRSLLIVYIRKLEILILTSCLSKDLYRIKDEIEIYEVPANSIIVFDILSTNSKGEICYFQNKTINNPSLLRFPNLDSYKVLEKSLDQKNQQECKEITKQCFNFIRNAVSKRINNLPDLVKKNLNTSTSIAILFSGGIDSLLLSYLVSDIVPDEVPINIDLINLSFQNEAPDRQTGLIAYYELLK